MKLVTSIFVVDVVVVFGCLDCAGARPNHLLLPSSSPCCSTPLRGLTACLPSCLGPEPMHSACGRTVYEQLLGTWHSTAEGTRQSLERETCRGVAQLSSLSCLLSNPQPAQLPCRLLCNKLCVEAGFLLGSAISARLFLELSYWIWELRWAADWSEVLTLLISFDILRTLIYCSWYFIIKLFIHLYI